MINELVDYISLAKVGPVHLQMMGRGRYKNVWRIDMNQLLVIEGIAVRRDKDGRYCLNDLHYAAIQSGLNARTKEPSKFLANSQTNELVQELTVTQNMGIAPVSTVRGGQQQGTYVFKELVYAYAMWISPAFNLKVIRTFDALASQDNNHHFSEQVQAGVIILESAAKLLNLSNSSKLAGLQKLQQFAGIPNIMPLYAIDAPSDAVDGSSRPTKALSYLLKDYGIGLSANQVYRQLEKLGIIEHKQRPSRSGVGGIKQFWSLSAKGCMYGKNITSPANPRETQPHFFESKFHSLLKLLETVS